MGKKSPAITWNIVSSRWKNPVRHFQWLSRGDPEGSLLVTVPVNKKTLKHFWFGDMIHGDFLGYIGEYHGGIIWGYIGIYDQPYSINIYGLWVWLKIGYPIPLVASWSPVFHGHSCVTPHNSSHGNDAPYFKPGNHRNMMLEITTVWTKLCHSTPHPISEISKIPYGLWEIKATPQALKETVTSKSLHELWLIFSSPKAPPEKQKKWIVQAIFSV